MSEEAAPSLDAESPPADTSKVTSKEQTQAVSPPRGRYKSLPLWKKVLGGLLLLSPFLVFALWIAVHSIPWMGPLVANTLRATIGKENVTRLEEFVYSVEDKVNRRFKANQKPKAYWKVPAKTAPHLGQAGAKKSTSGKTAPEGENAMPEFAPFAPPTPGPSHATWSAEGDGEWVPMSDPRRPTESPRLLKTLLHPDESRSWAELFVVAVDLRTVSVLPVMGYQEPRSEKKEAENYTRHAKIPSQHYEALLGAFNGGFMAEHGNYGVYFDGITFIDPKEKACTLVHYQDGSFEIATWSKVADKLHTMRWFRQAPNCMFEGGKMHPNLKVHRARKWGATLDGNTVIRRSAVGLSKDRKILYVGISNHTTAKVMGAGMHHAGAHTVAQMDVNWSYPKFVTFEEDDKKVLKPIKLADGFEFSDKLYLRERSMRDFFYLARKEEVEENTTSSGNENNSQAKDAKVAPK